MPKRPRQADAALAQDIQWCRGIVEKKATQRATATTTDAAQVVRKQPPPVAQQSESEQQQQQRQEQPQIPQQAVLQDVNSETTTVDVEVPTVEQQQQQRFSDVPLMDLTIIAGPLVNGDLGDVCVTLRLRSSYALLREPEKFTTDVTDPAGIELFVLLESSPTTLYCQRGAQSLRTLAALLSSSHLSVTLMHSTIIYNLLFSFLGTERVTISERVHDVDVMSSLVQGTLPTATSTNATAFGGFAELVGAVFPGLVDVQDAAPCSESPFYIRDDLSKLIMLKGALLRRVANLVAQRSLLCDTRALFLCCMMHYHGFLVDRQYVSELCSQLDAKVHEQEVQVREEIGKIGRELPPQFADAQAETIIAADGAALGDLLLTALGLGELLPVATRGDVHGAAAIDALAPLHPLAAAVKRGRHLLLIRERMVRSLIAQIVPNVRFAGSGSDKSWSVHPTYTLLGSKTGRIHTSHPNLQGYPHGEKDEFGIRNVFVAPKGALLVSFDYSQIELRMLAHFSNDAELLRLFAIGTDVLSSIAADVFHGGFDKTPQVTASQRQSVKVLVYGLIYGMGNVSIGEQLAQLGSSLSALELRAKFLGRFTDVDFFLSATSTREPDLVAKTLLGRPRFVDPAAVSDRRHTTSTVIQGSAADLLKDAMWRLHEWRLRQPPGCLALLLTIHDEMIAAIPCTSILSPNSDQKFVHSILEIKEILEDPRPMGLRVSLAVRVRVGPSLGHLDEMPMPSS